MQACECQEYTTEEQRASSTPTEGNKLSIQDNHNGRQTVIKTESHILQFISKYFI